MEPKTALCLRSSVDVNEVLIPGNRRDAFGIKTFALDVTDVEGDKLVRVVDPYAGSGFNTCSEGATGWVNYRRRSLAGWP
jgi:hypothetical protein